MIDEEAVDELFKVVEDMSTVQYFPMVLNWSKGGSKRSVILSPISKLILISSNHSRISYKLPNSYIIPNSCCTWGRKAWQNDVLSKVMLQFVLC